MGNYTYQKNRPMLKMAGWLIGEVLAVALAVLPCPAQTQPAQQSSPTIDETLAKTVGFISVPYRSGAKTQYVSGTCFFVTVLDDRLGKGAGFLYTVTNRHVAMAEGADPKTLLPEVYVYVNLSKPAGDSAIFQDKIPLAGTTRWYFPSDETVDLAVLPTVPKPSLFDIEGIDTSLFATSEAIKSERINIGDTVFFIGFFFQFPGKKRAEPVYRHGEIAMMPIDPIPIIDGRDQKTTTSEHLYLADAHAFHGNSGSPLFVQVGGYRNGTMSLGGFPYQLIGVVNGFVPEQSDINATGAATFESSDKPNSGILTFVPAQELKDLLDNPELKKLREATIAALHKQ